MMYAGFSPAGTPMPTSFPQRSTVMSVALWVFIGVASALFALFLAAYVMRMNGSDWASIGMPWQLWLSSGLLAAGSAALEASAQISRKGSLPAARACLWLAGVFTFSFLAVQGMAWQTLVQMKITGTGNPAASFFYLLTAMHGLHVAGGLLCWSLVLRFVYRSGDAAETAWRLRLCARYWHFLLLLWCVLFAVLGWLTPEFVRFICGTGR